MKYRHDRMPQGQNQQQANVQPSRPRAAAPYRFDGATSQHNVANQKTSAPGVSLPGVNEFLAGAPAEPPVTLPPFSSLLTRPPAQFKPAPANLSGSQARVPQAQGYGGNDYFASANTEMPAQQPVKATSSPHSLLPIGRTVPEEQRLAFPRPSAIPMRPILEPSSRLPNFSRDQANGFLAASDSALSASSVVDPVVPSQQTENQAPAPSPIQLAPIAIGATGKIIKGRPGRPSNATRHVPVDPNDCVYSRSSNASLVDPTSGEEVAPGTQGAIPRNRFMADRPVDPETGEIVGHATELTVKYNTYKKQILVDRKTGRRLLQHQSGGIPYGRFLGRRLVNPDTGEFLRVNPDTGEVAQDVSDEEKLRAVRYNAYKSRVRRQRLKRAE